MPEWHCVKEADKMLMVMLWRKAARPEGTDGGRVEGVVGAVKVLLVRREGWPELHVNADMQRLEERRVARAVAAAANQGEFV